MGKSNEFRPKKDKRSINNALLQTGVKMMQNIVQAGLIAIVITDNYYIFVSQHKTAHFPLSYDVRGLGLAVAAFKDGLVGNMQKLGPLKMKSVGFAVLLLSDSKTRNLIASDLFKKGVPTLGILPRGETNSNITFVVNIIETLKDLKTAEMGKAFFLNIVKVNPHMVESLVPSITKEVSFEVNKEIKDIIKVRQLNQSKTGGFKLSDAYYKFYKDVLSEKMKMKGTFKYPVGKRRKPPKP